MSRVINLYGSGVARLDGMTLEIMQPHDPYTPLPAASIEVRGLDDLEELANAILLHVQDERRREMQPPANDDLPF